VAAAVAQFYSLYVLLLMMLLLFGVVVVVMVVGIVLFGARLVSCVVEDDHVHSRR
jgi:hypothetical protein